MRCHHISKLEQESANGRIEVVGLLSDQLRHSKVLQTSDLVLKSKVPCKVPGVVDVRPRAGGCVPRPTLHRRRNDSAALMILTPGSSPTGKPLDSILFSTRLFLLESPVV